MSDNQNEINESVNTEPQNDMTGSENNASQSNVCFCSQCGTENVREAKFCKNCGASLAAGTQNDVKNDAQDNLKDIKAQVNSTLDNTTKAVTDTAQKWGEKIKQLPKKTLYGAIGGAVALIVALVAIISFFVIKSNTINLNDYITIEAEGYDGYGKAVAKIDWDAIESKYDKKIKLKSQKIPGTDYDISSLMGLVDPMDVFKSCISVELDKSSEISNGDTVNYTWKIADDFSKTFKCRLKYKNASSEVSGLKPIGKFDAFDDLEVKFAGKSPNGRVSAYYKGEMLYNSEFEIDKKSSLKNGDKVKVTISKDAIDRLAKRYGKVPENMEKEYTVEGLESYVTKVSDISEADMKELQKNSEKVHSDYVKGYWSDKDTLTSMKYIGSYNLTRKEYDGWYTNNMLYLVYSMEVDYTAKVDGNEVTKKGNYYWYIRYNDLIKDSKGNLKKDYSYRTPSYGVTFKDAEGEYRKYYCKGYLTLDELKKDVITPNMKTYDLEDKVEDKSGSTTKSE